MFFVLCLLTTTSCWIVISHYNYMQWLELTTAACVIITSLSLCSTSISALPWYLITHHVIMLNHIRIEAILICQFLVSLHFVLAAHTHCPLHTLTGYNIHWPTRTHTPSQFLITIHTMTLSVITNTQSQPLCGRHILYTQSSSQTSHWSPYPPTLHYGQWSPQHYIIDGHWSPHAHLLFITNTRWLSDISILHKNWRLS